jgi:hypothetical protein
MTTNKVLLGLLQVITSSTTVKVMDLPLKSLVLVEKLLFLVPTAESSEELLCPMTYHKAKAGTSFQVLMDLGTSSLLVKMVTCGW